jgi:hypothetical protein
VLVFLLSIFYSATSFGKTDVYYAGLSFLGTFQQNKIDYPFSVELANETNEVGLSRLESALLDKARQSESKEIDLIFSELADYRQQSAISMAFAIDWENVVVEQIGDLFKLVVDVHGQIVFFDYSTMKVVGSYPIAVQLRDVKESQPTEDDIRAAFRIVYLDDQSSVNIFTEFSKRFSSVSLSGDSPILFRVSNVSIEEDASSLIPLDRTSVDSVRALVAQNFTKYFSLNQKLSLLPYVKGETIGMKMALRFANGDVFNLEIPDHDISIELSLRNFRKVKGKENNVEEAWVYASYVNVRVVQETIQKEYMDVYFRKAVVKQVPKSQQVVDDWAVYQESLFVFFDDLSRQVEAPNKDWLRASTRDESAKAELEAFYALIEKFR